jgi:hypothetical protein
VLEGGSPEVPAVENLRDGGLLADRHGPHLRIHLERLRLATLLLHLQRYAEVMLGIADRWSWTCPVPPFP